jgi:hypothetical protein
MANAHAVGATGRPFPMDIERGKIREFARAIGSDNPDYLTAECPVVPPTFLTTTFFWQLPEDNPWSKVELDPQRGLHAEQSYEFFGPPPAAGDALTCQSTVTDVYEKQNKRGETLTFAVMTTDFHDADGRLVARAILTGVETAKPVGSS